MTSEQEHGRSGAPQFSSWFLLITALFVTCLLTANIIAVKRVDLGGLVVPAGLVIFPLSYIFGDVLTEVYGYRRARLTIWIAFFCNLLMVAAIWAGGQLPPAANWGDQAAYQSILGFTPRLLLASFLAYLVGEFTNSFILARLKVATAGRHLWLRTISSTLVGEGLDTLIFILVAFNGLGLPLGQMILSQWVIKVAYEVLATPLTYAAVSFLKRKEGLDTYDHDTNFNPLRLAS